jgi:hypothetical protein
LPSLIASPSAVRATSNSSSESLDSRVGGLALQAAEQLVLASLQLYHNCIDTAVANRALATHALQTERQVDAPGEGALTDLEGKARRRLKASLYTALFMDGHCKLERTRRLNLPVV